MRKYLEIVGLKHKNIFNDTLRMPSGCLSRLSTFCVITKKKYKKFMRAVPTVNLQKSTTAKFVN